MESKIVEEPLDLTKLFEIYVKTTKLGKQQITP